MRQLRLVERLLAGLSVRVTQTGLFLVHVLAAWHAAGIGGHRDRLAEQPDVELRARVARYSKLHEQRAEQRDERGDEAGWTGQFHSMLDLCLSNGRQWRGLLSSTEADDSTGARCWDLVEGAERGSCESHMVDESPAVIERMVQMWGL